MTTELPRGLATGEGTVFMNSEHGHEKEPLDCFFSPVSVAVVGATDRPDSVGNTVLRNLVGGYKGRIYPVNPGRTEICGLRCHAAIRTVPEAVDLVVIVIPANAVPDVVAECVAAKARAIIVISAGFKEKGPEGAALEKQIRRHLEGSSTRLIGPNCLGLMNPLIGLNATFAQDIARPGSGYELALGRLAFDRSWNEIASDFDLFHEKLLPLGLLFLFFSPLLAAWLRSRIETVPQHV